MNIRTRLLGIVPVAGALALGALIVCACGAPQLPPRLLDADRRVAEVDRGAHAVQGEFANTHQQRAK